MNINYLISFLTLIKLGSYTKAAKKLYITQPGLSFQIKQLEKEVGLPLFDNHHTRNLHLTEAGKRLFKYAEYISHEQLNFRYDIQQLSQEYHGNLFLGTSHIPVEFILPAVFSEFKEQYSGIGIKVNIEDSVKIIENVKNGLYEIGFCSLIPQEHSLEYFKIGDDEIVLIVNSGHPLSSRKDVISSELIGESFVLREEPAEKDYGPSSLLLKAGFDLNQCKSNLVLGTNTGVVKAVESGAGIAFVSNLAAQESIALGKTKLVKVNDLSLSRSFYCIYKKQSLNKRINKEFITFIRQRLSN
jgi:LysR family transcriptional regulator, transcriptional activator of the cysJI operon